MLLGKKKTDTQEERNNVLRQKIISFKKFFGTDEGREVMLDLMNKFYILNPLPVEMSEFERGRAEGKRDTVLYMLSLSNTDMARLDKIMRGDFT